MSNLINDDLKIKLPKMHKVHQKLIKEKISDLEHTLITELNKNEIKSIIKPNQKIAIAVGSRGIKNLLTIVKTTIKQVIELGGEPFIITAMGSHGGGTAEGQKQVLYSYGMTEEELGVPIISNIEVEKIAQTSSGVDIYFDKAALKADVIIPINRIKLHTDFTGEIQSGLCKMLVIGLGNQIGCSTIHEVNPDKFSKVIEEAASLIIQKLNIGFGIAIVENGYDQTAIIEAISAKKIIIREKQLLKISKEYMPKLMIPDIDVLVVEEIGKNISGAGFDPNVLGKSSVLTEYELKVPSIKKMVLLDITEVSHGNGIGVGLFDVIVNNVYNKLNLQSIYINAIACKCIEDAKIPLIAENEEEAIEVAIKTCRHIDYNNLKIVKIKNTSDLECIEVSENLLQYVSFNENFLV